MFKKFLVAGIALGAIAMLAACGGGGSGSDNTSSNSGNGDQAASVPSKSDDKGDNKAAQSLQMCKLIGSGDIDSVFGEPMKDGVESDYGTRNNVSINQCTWLAESTSSRAIASVFARQSGHKEALSAMAGGMAPFEDAKEVSGFGEKAYYIPSTGQLNFVEGDAWFIVTAAPDGMPTADVSPTLKQLADRVIERY